MEITIRAATEADIEGVLAIINRYAADNLMLPRTAEQIRRVLRDLLVAEHAGRVVGCGSNVPLTAELTELRSLAVAPEFRSGGLGRRLVEALIAKARADGFGQICALTLADGFFSRMGFVTVDRWAIPPKIWHECIYCPKFDACDEIAVLMSLTESQTIPAPLAPEVAMELWQGVKIGRMQRVRWETGAAG
jgi:amino-acid N-acetyltransferase